MNRRLSFVWRTMSFSLCMILQLCLFRTMSIAEPEIKSLENLQELIERSKKHVQSLSTKYEQFMDFGTKGKMTIQGEMHFKEPDLMKIEFTGEMMRQKVNTTIVNDGEWLWTESRIGGKFVQIFKTQTALIRKVRQAKVPELNAQEMNIEQILSPFESLKKKYDLFWKGKTELDGETFYEIDAILSETAKESLAAQGKAGKAALALGAKQLIFCDVKSGFLRKLLVIDKTGKNLMKMAFSDQVLNPSFSETYFDYKPPEGVRVVDTTDMVKQMLINQEKMSDNSNDKTPEKRKEN